VTVKSYITCNVYKWSGLVIAIKLCQDNMLFTELESKVKEVKFIFSLFPEIWCAFKDSFERSTSNDLINNPLIYYCLPVGYPIGNYVMVDAIKLLHQINEGLKFVREKCPSSPIFQRLTSAKAEEFHGVVEELLAMYVLAKTFGEKNVIPYPRLSNGKESDVMVHLNNMRVYVEVGTLGARMSERRIEKILNDIAEWVCEKLSQNNKKLYLRVNIDTTEIPGKDGYIDEEKSFDIIKGELESMGLEDLLTFDCRGLLNLEAALQAIEYDPQYLNPSVRKLGMVDNPQVRQWISTKKSVLKDLKFIKSIVFYDSPVMVVEVGTIESHPSELSEKLLGKYADHIIRHLKSQLKQTEPNSANVIAINTKHWSLQRAEDLDVYFKETLFNHLKDRLKSMLEENVHVSGVILFFDTIDHGFFISNPKAKISIDWFIGSLKLKSLPLT